MARKTLRELLNAGPSGLDRATMRNARRMVGEAKKRRENIQAAVLMSGAGFPVDQQLRQFLKACNDDLLAGIDPPYPKVWDVVSAWFRRDPDGVVPYLLPRPERDHAFTGSDFFAFATDPSLREGAPSVLAELPEGIVHNYSVKDDPRETLIEEEGRPPLVFSGISFVRLGSQLYWHTACGPRVDLAAVTAERRAVLASQEASVRAANPGAPRAMLDDLLNPAAAALRGTDDVWNCAGLGLFNLSTGKHDIRMIMKDWTVSQAVFSDQFEQKLADRYETDEAVRRMVDKAMVQLDEDRLFFDVAETAFALPAYFRARVEYLNDERVVTKLGDPAAGTARKYALKAPPDLRIMTRTVATLDLRVPDGGRGAYAPPRYQVEVEGFWRRLPPGQRGRDAEGNAVEGKTWVASHARWKDRPPRLGVLHVKTPIRDALARAGKMAEGAGGEVRLRLG